MRAWDESGEKEFVEYQGEIFSWAETLTKDETYADHREDTVAPLPLGQTTVSGFRVMPPPQEKPTHASEIGETICRSVSNGALVDALSGTAMRKTGIEVPHEYSR